MIDASKGYIKDGNKNRLREQDIHKIVDAFNRQWEMDKYARFVPYSEIEKNEYNLNIPRYIDTQEEEDIHQDNRRILTVYNHEDKEICWFDFIEVMEAVGEVEAGQRKESVQNYILNRIPIWARDI